MACPFFLSVPARAPRTEWVCHAVAAASSWMVAPPVWRRRATRVSSFEAPGIFAVGLLEPVFGLFDALLISVPFDVRGHRAPLPARARVAGTTTNAHIAHTIHRIMRQIIAFSTCSCYVPTT